MINYHNKFFKPLQNSVNGETDTDTVFHYQQKGNIVTCRYAGKKIVSGHLIALVDSTGCLDMRYHQINVDGEINTGICKSIPTILADGKIQLNESWQWTSGDQSAGNSILIEL